MSKTISADRLAHWKAYVEKHKSADEKWYRKMNKAWVSTRHKRFTKIIEYRGASDTWKLAHLLILAKEKSDTSRYSASYINRWSEEQKKDARDLLEDFGYTSPYRYNAWLNQYLSCGYSNIDTIKYYIEKAGDEIQINNYSAIRYLAQNNALEVLDLLKEKDILPEDIICQVVQQYLIDNKTIYAARLKPYLSEKDRAALLETPQMQPETSNDNIDGWHPVDDNTISHVQNLPGNLVCQEVFNFFAREVRSVTRCTTPNSGQMTEKIRSFNDIVEKAVIDRAAKKLVEHGGDPDPHKREKTAATAVAAPGN